MIQPILLDVKLLILFVFTVSFMLSLFGSKWICSLRTFELILSEECSISNRLTKKNSWLTKFQLGDSTTWCLFRVFFKLRLKSHIHAIQMSQTCWKSSIQEKEHILVLTLQQIMEAKKLIMKWYTVAGEIDILHSEQHLFAMLAFDDQ